MPTEDTVVDQELPEVEAEPERVSFTPMVLPIFKVLPKFITDFVEQVKKLAKIPEEKRLEFTQKA